MKVLANGLHNTQGIIAVGSANMDSVMIENQTYNRDQESVNRIKVIPNEILLRFIARVETVSPVAPYRVIVSRLSKLTDWNVRKL